MNVHSIDEKRIKRRHQLNSQVVIRDVHTQQVIGQIANLHQEGLMLVGSQLTVNASYQIELHLPLSVHSQKTIELGIECLWHQALGADTSLYWSGCTIIDKTPAAERCIDALLN